MSADHDPLCDRHPVGDEYGPECQCDLIARVRADERKQARQRVALAKAEFVRVTGADEDSWACRVYDDAWNAAGGDA